MGMKDDIRKVFPEIAWIKDEKLQEQVVSAWELAIQRGGWKGAQDIERMPFTLLKPVKISFAQHVRAVTRVCAEVAKTFEDVYQGELSLKWDILMAGALLHDVGKMLEIGEKDGKFGKSADGKLVRHPFSGLALADACGLPAEVLHIIGTHSKEGDPFKRTPEAIILHYADFMNFDPLEG